MKRLCFLLVPGLVIASNAAFAQQTDRTLGETLFTDAKKAMDAGNLAEACPKFDDSYHAYPGTGALLNAAACYEQAGKLATAWGRYGEAIAAARRDGADDRVNFAQERRSAIEPKLSRFTVAVSEAARAVPGLEIVVNGRTLPKSAIGLPIPTDAGTVKVEARAPGKKPLALEATLRPAAQESVTIGPLEDAPADQSAAPPPAAAPTGAAQPSAAPAVQESSSSQKVVGFVIGGIGIIGLGTGIAFNVLARSAADEADARCLPDSPSGQCDLATEDDMTVRQNNLNAARSNAIVSYVGLGVGAAALATGAILVFTAPSKTSEKQAKLVPTVAPGLVGVTLKGSL